MEKTDEIKRKIITSMVAIILLILTIFGITYAYFVSKVKGNTNDKSVDVSAGKLELTYNDGNGYIKVEKIQPGVVLKSKTFTVKNTGTGSIDSYEIILENVINELKYYNDLTYELECISDKGTCNGTNDTFPIYDNSIITNSIKTGETHTYTLTLSYNETYLDQSDDMAKTIEAKVNIRDSEFNYTKLNIYGNTEGLGTLVNDETNRFNGKYKIDIKSIGKNLFDKNNPNLIGGYISNKKLLAYTPTIGSFATFVLNCKQNTTYTVSRQIIGQRFVVTSGENPPAADIFFTNELVGYTKESLTITTGERDKYLYVWFYNSQYDTYTYEKLMEEIQVEECPTATSYEPYEEEVYSIYIDEPLRCLDSTCDYVDLVNKKIIRRIKNDNGTLSILDNTMEEKIQSVDSDLLINRNIVVDGANIEQELDR